MFALIDILNTAAKAAGNKIPHFETKKKHSSNMI
jgi:hypothetical protein